LVNFAGYRQRTIPSLLLVVDEQYRCVGLITVMDIEKAVGQSFDVRFSPRAIALMLRRENGAKGPGRVKISW
jgi:hypothetical protein